MKPETRFHRFPGLCCPDSRPSQAAGGRLPALQTHSSQRSLSNSISSHPQVAQGKQREQLRRVLCQPFVANLGEAELTLDHPKRMLDLGANAGFDVFQFVLEGVTGFGFVQRFALARRHGNLPVHLGVLVPNLLALFNAPVARVGKDNFFLSVQQGVRLHHIVCIGRRRHNCVNQTRLSVHANVRLHAEVPLVAFLDLVHLGVALTFVVLGGTGRRNQGGIFDRAGLEHQAFGRQRGVDGGQQLSAQVVRFEQVAKAQDRAFIGQAGDARIELRKLAVQRDVMQSLFHGRIRQTKPLLHEANTQQGEHRKRRPTGLARRRMRLNQRDQCGPRHQRVHLSEKFTLARALGDKLESAAGKAFLFHQRLTSERFISMTYADLP